MAYENGKLPPSALAAIPGGRLADDGAAAGWNAGPAKAGCRPLGPNSSYRDLATQVYYYNQYLYHGGNLAAVPGTSNHGWGHAVDLADGGGWMRSWIIEHGHAYGWYWGEAPSEPWHVTFDGSYSGHVGPKFVPLAKGRKNNKHRVKLLHKLLRHAGGVLARKSGKRRRRFRYWRGPWTTKFGSGTRRAVIRFQRDHKLRGDGIVGPKTWHKLRLLGQIDGL